MSENIFFTADHHHDHPAVLKFSHRPFKDVDEMTNTIINNWNSLVGNQDRVYFLGDFTFNNDRLFEYLDALNGRIFFIYGNHDKKVKIREARDKGLIEWCGDVYNLKIKREGKKHSRKIFLSHYPHRAWPNSHYGSFNLHGHCHGDFPMYGRSLDVGVDCWSFYPISYERVETILSYQPVTNHHQ